MQFIIIEEKKLIIFWSPKCGCSTLKTIIAEYYNINDKAKYKNIHINEEMKRKINYKKHCINKYKDYNIVMLIRNPYERLISGFLNKYVFNNNFEKPTNCNCFFDFCNILQKNPNKINKHHFEKQTKGKGWKFYIELGKPKIKYLFETSQVNNLQEILGLNLKKLKMNFTHINNDSIKKVNLWNKNFEFLLENKEILNYPSFYNKNLKEIVYKIYKDDFTFFRNALNINYSI
jgi:hypothetical protein